MQRVSLAGLLRVPSAGQARFRGIVAPSAPWTFAAPSISFAVLPGLVVQSTGGFEVGFAALMAGMTLGLGIVIQPVARRLDRVGDVRAGCSRACSRRAPAWRWERWPRTGRAGRW